MVAEGLAKMHQQHPQVVNPNPNPLFSKFPRLNLEIFQDLVLTICQTEPRIIGGWEVKGKGIAQNTVFCDTKCVI